MTNFSTDAEIERATLMDITFPRHIELCKMLNVTFEVVNIRYTVFPLDEFCSRFE